jgi:hypothetical protein
VSTIVSIIVGVVLLLFIVIVIVIYDFVIIDYVQFDNGKLNNK